MEFASMFNKDTFSLFMIIVGMRKKMLRQSQELSRSELPLKKLADCMSTKQEKKLQPQTYILRKSAQKLKKHLCLIS